MKGCRHGQLVRRGGRVAAIGLAAWLGAAAPGEAKPAKPKEPVEEEFFVRHRPEANDFFKKKAVHRPVAEHRCAVCHAAIEEPKKLSKPVEELCITCHESVGKELKGKHVHAILESGDCLGCHDPHASDFPFRLTDEINAVCSTCHQIGDDPIRKSHGGIVVKRVRCTDCHSPHGSDQEKMIRNGRLHPPFESKDCTTCHAAPDAEGGVQLVGDGTKFCVTCHPGIEEELGKKVPHPPAKSGTCWACHNPHTGGSLDRAFLKDRPETVCRTCHSTVFDLNHPVARHPSWKPATRDPRDPTKPFDCASCHAAHGSEFKRLRRWDLAEFCFTCHPQ
ncbi:MAG: cytochrome c3 family protein [Candidatus Coatesbacteria bacterium]